MRRFLGLFSSFSPSLASRLAPADDGVCGGVVMGTPPTLADAGVAVTAGTVPPMRGGLLTTPVWTVDCVATDDVELLRAGDAGR